jgi:hypothetical protein
MVCRKLKNHITNVQVFIERETDNQVQTSGTPPTLVLTVNSPQLAASRMAMQNASVSELKIRKGYVSVLLWLSIKWSHLCICDMRN